MNLKVEIKKEAVETRELVLNSPVCFAIEHDSEGLLTELDFVKVDVSSVYIIKHSIGSTWTYTSYQHNGVIQRNDIAQYLIGEPAWYGNYYEALTEEEYNEKIDEIIKQLDNLKIKNDSI